MSNLLLDVAMGFVKSAGLRSNQDEMYQNIRQLFEKLIAGELDSASRFQLEKLLIDSVGTNSPLEKMEAVLTCNDTPIPVTQEYQVEQNNSFRRKTHPWAPNEDIRLLAGINRFGLENWQLVASFVGNGRTRAQCAQRWSRGLDPHISKDQWTNDEEKKLIELLENGSNRNWTVISSQMGNRSDVQCRYHFLQMQRDPSFREKHPNLVQEFQPMINSPRFNHKLFAMPNVSNPMFARHNSLISKSPPVIPPAPPQHTPYIQSSFASHNFPKPPLPQTRERHGSFSGQKVFSPIFTGHEFDDLENFENSDSLFDNLDDFGTDFSTRVRYNSEPASDHQGDNIGSPFIW